MFETTLKIADYPVESIVIQHCYFFQLLSTLTFWATCGRPSGWEGVVCLGNPEKGTEVIN